MELKLRELRNEKGLTLIEVSNSLGMTPQVISRYERGDREPDLNTLILFANYYEVSTDYLLGREDDLGQFAKTPNLSKEENLLLSKFRLLSPTRQQTVLDTILYMTDSGKNKNSTNKSIL